MAPLQFQTQLLQFDKHGDKTNWIYITIPAGYANKLNPGVKKTYRIKGTIDKISIVKIAMIPSGDGSFIIPVNANLRKQLKKTVGAKVELAITTDDEPPAINEAFLICLKDEPEALKNFNAFPRSHQLYFSNWISSAKTNTTRDIRIAQSVNALLKNQDYGQMIRSLKKEK